MLRIRVLGPITAEFDRRPVELRGAHQRRLLGILAAADRRVVSTDRLVDQLWDGAATDAAARTFRTYVARLRRSLEAAGVPDGGLLVVTEAPGYRLGGEVTTDAEAFATAVEDANDRLIVGEAASAWTGLNDALALWSGNAFDEFADEEWASASAIRLEELRLVARELRIRAQIELGRHAEAIAEIDSLVAEHPLRETPRRELMIALYRSGRHAEALRAGREYARYLAEETGLEPSTAITEIEAMIIEGDPRLDSTPQGRRLRGYLLEEPISEGALGVVHRARQPSIGRDVAITVVPAGLADDPEFVRGFESRAQAVASVEHQGIVPIYDYWREPGGAYLVMRHYPAGTLARRLAAGPIPPDDAWAATKRVIAALWAAHQRGVAHGNLGPNAVWIDERGDAVLGEFSMTAGDANHQRDIANLTALVDSMLPTDSEAASTSGGRRLSLLAERLRAAGQGSVATTYDLVLDIESEGDWVGADGLDQRPPDALPRIVGPNPFKGLAAFSEADTDVFFGRLAIIDELADVLRRRGVAALVGPSGSGKSSVMRAGLLPRARAAGSYVTTMVPGTRPLDELEIALTRIAATPLAGLADELATESGRLATVLRSIAGDSGREIVLAIDQFEELFTISGADERDRFLDLLIDALDDSTAPISVVTTCRADFLGRVLDHPVAGRLLRDRTVLITPLTTDELYEAVVGPAEHAGIAVEPALVAQIVGDAAGAAGSLPMVQYVLTEVFEAASDDGSMTLEDYQRLGGVNGALAQRAEEVFGGLSTDDQAAARRLFTRLVAPGDASEPTRRRARRSELTTVPEHVVTEFGRARLLSFDRDSATREPTVEVSHEALVRHWPRLVNWIEDESEGLRLLGHLTTASQEWAEADRDPSGLYRGARLIAAEQWTATRPGELSELEAEFIAAGIAARDAEERRDRRSLTRLRGLAAGLAVFLVLAVVAAGVAVTARQRADDRADEAAETRRTAEVAALAGNARVLAEGDPITAMLLAVEASARSSADEPAVTAALLDSLSGDPRVVSLQPPVQTAGLAIQPPSGPFYSYVFATDEGARVEVRNVEDATVRTLDLASVPGAATTDPTGTFLYVADDDQLEIYDMATSELLAVQPTENFFILASGPDGSDDIASVYPDGRLVLHSVPSFEVLETVEVSPDVFTLARSGDGRIAATLDDDGTLVVASLDGSGDRLELPLPEQEGLLALDESGDRLALSNQQGTTIADLADPTAPSISIDAGASLDLDFSPDGSLIALGTDGGIEVYDSTTGELAAEPLVFASGVTFHFSGARTLRAFAPDLGVVSIDLDAPSRIVTETDVPGWGVAAFLAPDLSTAVGFESGSDNETLFTEPTGPAPVSSPIGLGSLARQSRPTSDGRHIVADTAALLLEEWRGSELLQTIDLASDVTAGYTHQLAPRVGRHRDILVLAKDDQSLLGSEVVVVDRERGEVVFMLTDRRITVAEFSTADEDEIIVGDTDGRVRWVGLGESAVSGESSSDGDRSPARLETNVGAGVGAFAVTPDGSFTAIGDWGGTITIVDADLQVVAELANDAPFPVRMAFVGDGARLVVQSRDGSIVLWDVASASRIGELYRTDGLRGAFEVTPGGSSIVVPTGDGITEITVQPSEWKRIACESVNRSLTVVELQSIVPGATPSDDPCGATDAAG